MRGGREPPCITFFIYPYDADVVLHPRQSLDPSSRGTTSPGPFGSTKKRAAVDFSKRQLPAIHIFNTSSSDYTNIVTNGMVNRDSRVVSA